MSEVPQSSSVSTQEAGVQPQGLPVHSRPLSTATIRARCTSLVLCWINALNEGLRGGDIGGIMDPAIQQACIPVC